MAREAEIAAESKKKLVKCVNDNVDHVHKFNDRHKNNKKLKNKKMKKGFSKKKMILKSIKKDLKNNNIFHEKIILMITLYVTKQV